MPQPTLGSKRRAFANGRAAAGNGLRRFPAPSLRFPSENCEAGRRTPKLLIQVD
jgi:hypothetical protein